MMRSLTQVLSILVLASFLGALPAQAETSGLRFGPAAQGDKAYYVTGGYMYPLLITNEGQVYYVQGGMMKEPPLSTINELYARRENQRRANPQVFESNVMRMKFLNYPKYSQNFNAGSTNVAKVATVDQKAAAPATTPVQPLTSPVAVKSTGNPFSNILAWRITDRQIREVMNADPWLNNFNDLKHQESKENHNAP